MDCRCAPQIKYSIMNETYVRPITFAFLTAEESKYQVEDKGAAENEANQVKMVSALGRPPGGVLDLALEAVKQRSRHLQSSSRTHRKGITD